MSLTCSSCIQERDVAKRTVLGIFPGSKVETKQLDKYPITVTIQAQLASKLVQVWSGSQKDLFGKNGHRAVPAIEKALKRLKAEQSE
jgi:hypothetical protein